MNEVTWQTNLGPLTAPVPDDKLMEFLEALSLLGFDCEVNISE